MGGASDPPVEATLREAIDGATVDPSMSGDAMRWSPELAAQPPGPRRPARAFPGIEAGSGLGALLALDAPAVHRLVSEALSSLAGVAGELRALLPAPPPPPDDED
ncbi:hypothetical protein [Blastococcus sp. SYSU D00820]